MFEARKDLVLYCDGSCEKIDNLLIGKYSYIAYLGNKRILAEASDIDSGEDITANVAEYIAVLKGLEALHAAGYEGQTILVRSDSKIVMQQLGMLCAVRSKRLLKWWYLVRNIAKNFDVHFEWVPRTWNREAHLQGFL